MRVFAFTRIIVLFSLLVFSFPSLLNAQEVIGNIIPPDEVSEDVIWDRFEAVWSPDGSLFAVSTFDQMIIYNQNLDIKTIISQQIYDFDWSPNSQQLAFVSELAHPDIYLWNRQGDNTFLPELVLPSPRIDGHLRTSMALAWNSDGTRLATLTEGGINELLTQIFIWDTTNWNVITHSQEVFFLDARNPGQNGAPRVVRLGWTPDDEELTIWGGAYCLRELRLSASVDCSANGFDGLNVINATSGVIESGLSMIADPDFFIWTRENHLIVTNRGVIFVLDNRQGELERIFYDPYVNFGSAMLTPWDDIVLVRRNNSLVLWRYLEDEVVYEVPIDDPQKYGPLARTNGYGWIPGQPKFFIIDNAGNVEVWDVSDVIQLPEEGSP
jgi:WD40 repeat protein